MSKEIEHKAVDNDTISSVSDKEYKRVFNHSRNGWVS